MLPTCAYYVVVTQPSLLRIYIASYIAKAMAQVSGIPAFLDEISRLIAETERQYGLDNRGCTEYALERLEYAITVCSDLSNHLRGVPGLEDYCSSTEDW